MLFEETEAEPMDAGLEVAHDGWGFFGLQSVGAARRCLRLYRCPSGFYVDCTNRYWLPVGYVSRWRGTKRPAPVWLLP